MASETVQSVEPLRRSQPQLWVLALLTFGLGDVTTTWVGIQVGGVSEVGPLTTPMLQRHGIAAMVALKVVVFGGGYAAWRVLPSPQRVGVPLGVAIVGVAITCWNAAVLLAAASQ